MALYKFKYYYYYYYYTGYYLRLVIIVISCEVAKETNPGKVIKIKHRSRKKKNYIFPKTRRQWSILENERRAWSAEMCRGREQAAEAAAAAASGI